MSPPCSFLASPNCRILYDRFSSYTYRQSHWDHLWPRSCHHRQQCDLQSMDPFPPQFLRHVAGIGWHARRLQRTDEKCYLLLFGKTTYLQTKQIYSMALENVKQIYGQRLTKSLLWKKSHDDLNTKSFRPLFQIQFQIDTLSFLSRH